MSLKRAPHQFDKLQRFKLTEKHQANVRYASACRQDHRHTTSDDIGLSNKPTMKLNVDDLDDKLKHIGHLLDAFSVSLISS
jgi:hypothetical protein